MMDDFKNLFNDALKSHPNYKVALIVFGAMEKITQFEDEISKTETYPLKSGTYNIHVKDSTEPVIRQMIEDINQRLEDLNTTGSGWVNTNIILKYF